jgi:hypothetical protein
VRFGFALAAVALIVVGILTHISVLRFRADAGLIDHTHQVLNALSELVCSVTGAESGQRGYVITGKEEYLSPYQAAVQAVDQQSQRLPNRGGTLSQLTKKRTISSHPERSPGSLFSLGGRTFSSDNECFAVVGLQPLRNLSSTSREQASVGRRLIVVVHREYL